MHTSIAPLRCGISCTQLHARPRMPHFQEARLHGSSRLRDCRSRATPAAAKPLVLAKLFLPDIAPGADPSLSEAAFARLRAEAIAMPLWELGIRTALEIAVLLIGWQVLTSVVKGLSNKGKQAIKQQIEEGNMNFSTLRVLSDAAIVAVQRPAKYFIPIVAISNILRTATMALQIAAESDLLVRLHWIAQSAVGNLTKVLGKADAKLIDCSEVGICIFLTWFFLSWKQELTDVAIVMEHKLKERGQSDGGLERAVRPFSQLLGWAIIACGGLSVLHVVNVNIQPLLAVGGVGGLAVGFGAQVVTANALSGINLFVTRPFVVGDRITLKTSGGGVIISGVVESISPMRTVIRTDDNVPEGIPNKAITDCIVCNESSPRKVVSSDLLTKDPRKYRHSFTLKISDLDKLEVVRADLRKFLESHPGVDRAQPLSVNLTNFSGSNFDIGIEAHTVATHTEDFSAFHSDMITQVARTFKHHSAEAA